ncbi:hypothetical protein [Sphingomonas sp.]|nr:hypothetical protein [Sphingomonas sp.]
MRDLIRRDQKRSEKVAQVQRLVDEARVSGVSDFRWTTFARWR